MNIKIFVQGVFGRHYSKGKDLLHRHLGSFFIRPPREFEIIFHLEEPMDGNERKQRLNTLFSDFIVPLTDKALTLSGIKELV